MDAVTPRSSGHNLRVVPIAVLFAANVATGWYWGYQSVAAYLAFWLLAALTLLTARRIVVSLLGPTARVHLIIAGAVLSFAIVVACGLLLGFVHQLGLTQYLLLQSALWAVSLLIPASRASEPPAPEPIAIFPWVAGIVGALVASAVAFGIAHQSAPLYDSLSYHLFFAARWLQDRAIAIIPTPFSDPAQAYAPANGELYFTWLMLPFHGDLVARIGQLPFAVLAALTLYALTRRLGASAAHAVYPAVFFLLSRPILEQMLGANVDLICATLFLTSLYLGLVAVDRDRRGDWILWGVSVGLYAGSKYLALVYLPVLALLVVLAKRPRTQLLWALPGIAAFALPWYARNWIVAGSPIYPAGLSVAGVTVASGAFNRTAMLNSVFHTNDVRLLPAMAAHALGPTLFVVWIPAAIIGGLALARGGGMRHLFVLHVPYLMVALYWFGLPVNIDSRFLMAAVAPALVPFAFTFRNSRAWDGAVHGIYAMAMIWIVAGAARELPGSVPWFMQGWLSLAGLIKPEFLWLFGLCALAMTFVWWAASRRPRWALSVAVLSVATSGTVLAIGGERWCVPSRCEYIDATSPHIGMDLVYAWRWLADNTRHATVAYTGINLPYPLTGRQLTNRVVYVNIDGKPGWRFHDYDRAVRNGFRPAAPVLATASGELRPVPQTAAFSGAAARPRYDRMQGERDDWVDSLKRLRVDYLFIAALSAYEIDNVWHTDRGFPIEEGWASADPDGFRLVYQNPLARIYTVGAMEDAQ